MKRRFSLIALLLALHCQPATAGETSYPYYVPPAQFNAALQVMDSGFANVFGLLRNATGSFNFEESTKTVSHVRFAIDARSLMAGNADNQQALQSLLEVERYPEIRFTALESYSFAEGKADIKGTLTLHGVSKPVTLQATLNRAGMSPRGGGMWASEGEALGLSMRGSFKRADFGMVDDPEIQGRFGDTITLMLETQAIRQ
jgi:polyisoprenoid-binding protein YceI